MRDDTPTMVFVHGNASTHTTWNRVIGAMPLHFRCVSYDLRGHGANRAPTAQLDLDLLVQDLAEVVVPLVGPVHLVGHSLGGMIAARYCQQHPANVQTLALLATPMGRIDEDLHKLSGFLQAVRDKGVVAMLSTMVSSWYSADFARAHPQIIQDRLDQFRDVEPDLFLRTYAIYAQAGSEPDPAVLPCPTLLMSGEYANGIDPARLLDYDHRFDHIKAKIYAGMSNGILTEIPEQVAQDLSEFINDAHRR